ncbi:MAG: hypothetical protein J5I91_05825 [Bacteroidetes bacterium]|nr:hypothetical protein [Bacteroidota bacterium]
MGHIKEVHDNYIYVKMTTPRFEFREKGGLIEEIEGLNSVKPNIVLDCGSIQEISDEDAFKIKYLRDKNKQRAGHILLCNLKEGLSSKLEALDLICVPTVEEAVDYIYFEEIENEFLSDFDENEE